MLSHANAASPDRRAAFFSFTVFCLCLIFNLWGVSVGWRSLNLPGHEFRQAQTALTAYHVKQTHDFSLDYATPVLGKPWAIPFEFPLYQWSVVVVSDRSGLGLIKAGRIVSLACFYLMVPALFLGLGNFGALPAGQQREILTKFKESLQAMDPKKQAQWTSGIRLLIGWGEADAVYKLLGDKVRGQPIEHELLAKISEQKVAVKRLVVAGGVGANRALCSESPSRRTH